MIPTKMALTKSVKNTLYQEISKQKIRSFSWQPICQLKYHCTKTNLQCFKIYTPQITTVQKSVFLLKIDTQLGIASSLFAASYAGGGPLYFQTRHISRHGGNKDFKKDFWIKKERPLGPHMILAPGEQFEGRVGPIANYRYRCQCYKNQHFTFSPIQLPYLLSMHSFKS